MHAVKSSCLGLLLEGMAWGSKTGLHLLLLCLGLGLMAYGLPNPRKPTTATAASPATQAKTTSPCRPCNTTWFADRGWTNGYAFQGPPFHLSPEWFPWGNMPDLRCTFRCVSVLTTACFIHLLFGQGAVRLLVDVERAFKLLPGMGASSGMEWALWS